MGLAGPINKVTLIFVHSPLQGWDTGLQWRSPPLVKILGLYVVAGIDV
jgi:hypothetical protein